MPKPKKIVQKNTTFPCSFTWAYGGRIHRSHVLPAKCPSCGAVAIVELPEEVRAIQPDDTTHVCHPSVGGCNQGFAHE